MKVALVHDYLNEFGGAERVLKTLSDIYPKAPIYVIYNKKDSAASKIFKNRKVIESWFGKLPFSHALISPLRFLLPAIWNSFDLSKYDLVVSSSAWGIGRGFLDAKYEICYLHTPPRYLYGYDTSRDWKNKWFSSMVRAYSLLIGHFLRMYDFAQAQKVDFYVTNSENIAKRLKKFYRREDYKVIYPPVELAKPSASYQLQSTDYYLTGGRLVKHKNFDVIVKAFNKLGYTLLVFGTGSQEKELKNIAGKNIKFLGRVSDSELSALYTKAKTFIVASRDEDFGITPVEAALAGTPTIAFKAEGYLESVVSNKTGVFFDEMTPDSIVKAVKKAERIKWNKTAIKRHGKRFSEERFKREIRNLVKEKVK